MNKLITIVLLLVFPGLVLADNSLNFAPPASDYSVVFLANLFGIVDGVLSGTGSQIMGSMFAVFNSAVLAIGGVIIMYTLMVSTMNTAHEGQMLGQKWSSIWIPVRSTMGLALLVPKASGYCLMQIFVMWIVVQGVGAADKVWNAALSYLNRGGVIIQAQQINPATALTGNSAMSEIATGALNILAGQVCMLGLQTQLQNQRQTYLNSKANGSGPCAGTPSAQMALFCNTAVPDFIGSVNMVSVQNASPNQDSFLVKMPNFANAAGTTNPYFGLNGICGTIRWNNISSSSSVLASATAPVGSTAKVGGANLTTDELSTAQMSRAIAIQQMYVDLASVAQTIIGNAPGLSTSSSGSGSTTVPYIANIATQQFGVPYTQSSTVCQNYSNTCTAWGPTSGSSGGATLFNGTEFLNAINDYNGVMMPTLNLIAQINDASTASDARAFINQASAQGWIMAGAYFFNLVKIQGSSTMNSTMTDSNTGLNKSTFDASQLLNAFKDGACTTTNTNLCLWFNKDPTLLSYVQTLITGTPAIAQPTLGGNPNRAAILTTTATSVYGLANNSVMIQLPGQPGLQPLTFSNTINFSVDSSRYSLSEMSFPCGGVKPFFNICLGQIIGNLFFNLIFLNIYNAFMYMFNEIINQVVMAFLMIPLSGMAGIFKQGMAVLSAEGANPVVALANMGVQYINFAGNLWMMLLSLSVTSSLLPILGVFIFALMSLAMPLLMAWVGVMVSIGFTTAYYIPILPYMIFTFGALAWLISVIEAMVAAPIVALGVTHPEGHDAFGKGEAAIMILLNVFLRPSMMIIGYIAAIALSYVGVWILNAGFDTAIGFVQQQQVGASASWGTPSGSGGYSDWAGIYAFFFSILTYTTMYLVLVQKSFTLISVLPDKVLRWIGGNPESSGQESAQWAGDVQKQQEGAATKTSDAQGAMDKKLGAYGMKGANAIKGGLSSAASMMGGGGGVEASADGGGGGGGSSGDVGGSGGGGDGGGKSAQSAMNIAKGAGGA